MSVPPPAAVDTVRVTIAVPTYRRHADLQELLPQLLGQAREVSGRFSAEVLVVDNDPAGSAAGTVRGLAAPGLRYVAEPTPGIAAARNRAIDEAAGSRLLVFIDDDERPVENWLGALLDTWRTTGAAAVSGRILARYSGALDPWIEAGDFFVRRRMPTGTAIDVAAAGNLLLDLEQVRRAGVRFSSALGLAGGEDTLFSRTLARAGGRLVWCDESVAVDVVPPQRMTRAWVLTRAWSHGNAAVLTDLRLAPSAWARAGVRARAVAGGLVRIAGGAARWATGAVTGAARHQARGLRAVCRGAGMAGAAVGLVYEEYARSGRRWRLSWRDARREELR